MAHGFPPPFCTGKKFLQDENGKIYLFFFFFFTAFYLYKMVVENRVPYVHTEFGEGVTVQLNKTKF
jgi:hypothetical protein